jgi:hypothetical protein
MGPRSVLPQKFRYPQSSQGFTYRFEVKNRTGIVKPVNIDKIAQKPVQNLISEIWKNKIENRSESRLIAR